MENLSVIHGGNTPGGGRQTQRENMVRMVHAAKEAGFTAGRDVLLGAVVGTVIGYNIAAPAIFHGARYPLLVETAYGVVKCSMDELALI
ncbi:MAG: hypothetical protein PHU46_02920 [Rhodocyclaceae bacterium]|nr:hypothetical protein [Rhodocyclaceae bacterium]